MIKSIVAEEMRLMDHGDYPKYSDRLSDAYKVWEHKSSYELCLRYNKINNNTVTVSMLSHEA